MPGPSALRRIGSYLAAASGDARLFAVGYLVLLPCYLAPLVVTAPFFPGLDLPFHLGMADMLAKAGDPSSPYAPYYQSSLSLAPYAAHYLALLGLSKIVGGILMAHHLLLGLYLAGMPLAMGSLLNVLGRSRLPALLAFPLAYNLPLHYGFISFAFSLPILVLTLAQLARLLLAETRVAARWALTAALGVLLFLCHLQNFLFGVCAAVAFAMFSAVPWRRRLQALAAFLPSVAALVYWQMTQRPDAWNRPRGLRFAWLAVKTARLRILPREPWPWWVDFKNRVMSLPDNALRAFHDRAEVDAANAIILLIAFYFLVALVGRWLLPGSRSYRPRMRAATWVAFAGALAAYYLLPHHLNEFDIVTFFPRFAPLVLLMTLPLISRGLLHFPVSHRALLMVPALVLGVAWGRQLTDHFKAYAAELTDFRAVMAAAEPGHKLINMPFERRSRVLRIESVMLGLGSFYTVLKPAPGTMVPLMYCDMLHIPCVIKKVKGPGKEPPRSELHDPSPWGPDQVNMDLAMKFYDYFLIRSPPRGRDIFGKHKDRVKLVINRGPWWLWQRK